MGVWVQYLFNYTAILLVIKLNTRAIFEYIFFSSVLFYCTLCLRTSCSFKTHNYRVSVQLCELKHLINHLIAAWTSHRVFTVVIFFRTARERSAAPILRECSIKCWGDPWQQRSSNQPPSLTTSLTHIHTLSHKHIPTESTHFT